MRRPAKSRRDRAQVVLLSSDNVVDGGSGGAIRSLHRHRGGGGSAALPRSDEVSIAWLLLRAQLTLAVGLASSEAFGGGGARMAAVAWPCCEGVFTCEGSGSTAVAAGSRSEKDRSGTLSSEEHCPVCGDIVAFLVMRDA
jgi:hypothetical protein